MEADAKPITGCAWNGYRGSATFINGTRHSDIWLSSANGPIMHFDGQAWETFELNHTAYFDLLVFGPDSVLTGLGLTRMAHYDGSSWSAQELGVPGFTGRMRSATIPWRSQDYSMESLLEADRIVARPLFRKYSNDDAKQRLTEACPTFFGSKRFESIVEHNEAFSVSIDRGLAWVAKDSGALTLQRYPDKLEVSVVKDAQEAVQVAARELGKLGMWDLAEDVTLDIVSVSATMNASWDPHPDGTLTAVPVRHPLTGEDVTQYLSQHMVVFGRRFKGIPIERGALKVIIGAQGDLLGVLQEWREIIGEDDAGIAIDSSTTIEGRRDPEKAKLPLDTRVCAYFEASFVGWAQESPGVGCFYRSIVPGGIGLGRIQTDFVSMTSDATVSLTGQRLGSNP